MGVFGRVAVFGQSGCIRAKWFYSEKGCFIRAKVTLIGQKFLYSGKVVVFGKKLLYSGKCGCIRANWLFFGKKWLCSGKKVFFRANVVVFG